MNILTWIKNLNLLVLIIKLYPIVKAAVEEVARETSDSDHEWSDQEKKAFAIRLIYIAIEEAKLNIPKGISEAIPDIIEIVWHLIVKRSIKVQE